MGNPSNRSRRTYPVSLRCAAEAAFGPNARLSQLIDQQPLSPATSDEQEKTTCTKRPLPAIP
jgi:hypothetical protein